MECEILEILENQLEISRKVVISLNELIAMELSVAIMYSVVDLIINAFSLLTIRSKKECFNHISTKNEVFH